MTSTTVSRETANGTKLRAIAGVKPGEPLTKAIVSIPVDSIDVGPNVRVDVAGVDELAESIKAHGVLQPIKVRAAGDGWLVVWGQRRLLAARKAGLERIPAITTVDEPEAAELAIEQLVENLHRADLNPVDRARSMRQVVDAGMSQADLARELGLHPSTIANDLGILAAPEPVLALIVEGKLSPAHQRAMKGLDAKAQTALAREAAKDGWSAHRTEDEVQRQKRMAENEKANREREAKQNARRTAQLNASIAGFEGKKVPKDAVIIVKEEYGGSGARLVALIKAAGYPNARLATRRNEAEPKPGGGLCDCTVWKAGQSERGRYEGSSYVYTWSVSIAKACIVAKHQQAKADASDAKRQAKEQLAADVQQAVRKTAFAVAIPPTSSDTPLLFGIPRILAEATVWAALSWNAGYWAKKRGGSESNPWPTLHALSDEDLAKELAERLVDKLRDQASYHVDWATLATELLAPAAPAAAEATETLEVPVRGRQPKLKDPVVVAGIKYRIRKILTPASADQLAIVELATNGTAPIVAAVEQYDADAHVYRGHEQANESTGAAPQ